eukprot:TRINITY_DN2147_c0_g1_i1.p3 TRINITY_DN2147_c0_g1~~TRINITY_DN2147_c0_g1_i1.p3  ORF type:complete len:199 (+),score=45.74 TRINITY_DN2147_c0_g1_i1:1167-1763(+)
MSEIIADLPRASGNSNGIHATKKILSLTLKAEYEKYRTEVAQAMVKDAVEMAQDPFGNYALQMVLDTYPPNITSGIIEIIKSKIASLSLVKYSSNVVECCMKRAAGKQREEFIRELVESENLPTVLKSRFGSQIVQKALALAEPALKAEFKERLQSIISSTSKKQKIYTIQSSGSYTPGPDLYHQNLNLSSFNDYTYY